MNELQKKNIAIANYHNPYTDITPLELKLGLPIVNYEHYFPDKDEIILYVTPAKTFKDKNKIAGYNGKSSGASIKVAKGLTIRTGNYGGNAIHQEVRGFNSGDLIITNKKVVFIGKDDNFNIDIKKIITNKPLDKNSFILQYGKSSKNIYIDDAVSTIYTLSIIKYAIEGSDSYEDLLKEKNKLTKKQLDLCSQISKECNIWINDFIKKNTKTKRKKWWIIPLLLFIIISLILGYYNTSKENENNASHTVNQIITLEEHPKVFDEYEKAIIFSENLKDNKVKVITEKDLSQIERKLKNPYDDETMVYLIQDSTHNNYIGRIKINIPNSKTNPKIDINEAVNIITSYLPKNFLEVYKIDKSYLQSNGNNAFYTYSFRLNENNKNINKTYPYYYSFYVRSYDKGSFWILETDYSALGDHDKGWIEKNTNPWEIDLSQYFQ